MDPATAKVKRSARPPSYYERQEKERKKVAKNTGVIAALQAVGYIAYPSEIETHTTADTINCDLNMAAETEAAVAASINDGDCLEIGSSADIQATTDPEAACVWLDTEHCTSKHTHDTSTQAKHSDKSVDEGGAANDQVDEHGMLLS